MNYLPAPIAARLLGVTPTRLKTLAEEGVIRAYAAPGARGTWYSRADVGHIRNRDVTDADIEWAAELHDRNRLASQRAYDRTRRPHRGGRKQRARCEANARAEARQANERVFNPAIRMGDGCTVSLAASLQRIADLTH